ncbi:MAG: VWA domain-containing protein [Chloroflexi bacterium]|nr:VWA domain-containing protein [Chloroflexota bacterium]
MTGDVIDDFLPAATNDYWCAGNAGAVWADVDGDGNYETQVVFTTLTGEAEVIPESSGSGKRYFFSFIDSHCGGTYPYTDRGRFKIHFIDILAPGFVWDDSSTWVYKSVLALSVRASHDACWDFGDPTTPYQSVQAYRELGQIDPIASLDETPDGGWVVYRFSDPAGIKELYVSTDFCENILDDLILYDQELSPLPPVVGRAAAVLLFDTSGSMSWNHDGVFGVPSEQQRLTLAKDAAIPFIVMLNDFNSGAADFGIARFPGQQILVTPGCGASVVTPMDVIDDTNADTAVNTTIPGLSANGNTPLLAGIGTAMGMFTNQDRRVVVLLSDGYHNCPTVADVSDPAVQSLINQANAESTRLYTIGFGRPSDVDHPLLDALASQTGGAFYDVTGPTFDPAAWSPATALQEAYKAILVDTLNLQTGVDPLGVIDAGQLVSKKIMINENDRIVSFYLSWATHQQGRLGLTIRSSDGAVLPSSGTGLRVHEGETYRILTVQQAFLELQGKVGTNPWTIEIDTGGLGDGEREHYQYSVLIDSGLLMQTAVEPALFTTGDTVTLTAKLTDRGEPILGVTDVQVTFTGPEDGLGNWFAKNTVTQAELERIPKKVEEETLPDLVRKFRFLRESRSVALPGRTAPRTLKLYDDGTHGDAVANDGVYTAQFEVMKEGTYSFHFQSVGADGGKASFQREAKFDKYVPVKVAPDGIDLDVKSVSPVERGPGRLEVLITPRDQLGNYLGPRYAGAIKVEPSWGRLVGNPRDNLDGTYTQIVEVPTGLKDTVSISVSVAKTESSVQWSPQRDALSKISWLTWVLLMGVIGLVVALIVALSI